MGIYSRRKEKTESRSLTEGGMGFIPERLMMMMMMIPFAVCRLPLMMMPIAVFNLLYCMALNGFN